MRNSRFAREARLAVVAAVEEARRRREPRIGTEHLLYGVASVDEPVSASLELTPGLISTALDRRDSRALRSLGIEPSEDVSRVPHVFRRRRHLPFTTGAKQAMERALRVAIDEGHRRIMPTHILAGLALGGPNDPSVRLLRGVGVEPGELDAEIRKTWRTAS